ncbi:hypothetical protein [Streptomyces sp. NPDC047071]|uniref:hypothetical protein n=1 Tax=Streptomyces sp. NPDC047071 TaxID=3154808 RepID=UPI003455EC5E
MGSITEGWPTIAASRDGRFPKRPSFDTAWEQILETSDTWRNADCAEYIRGWCGTAPDHIVDHVAGVNHVGIYMGDYERDEEILTWNAYLRDLQKSAHIATVEMGPSYISPRQYGTPGWWNALVLPDGRAIETFACMEFGPWADRAVDERRRLMSHVAIDTRTEDGVRFVLDALERDVDSLEVIAFTEADELGHTYGHVRNNADMSVLEIVYQAPRDESEQPHGSH